MEQLKPNDDLKARPFKSTITGERYATVAERLTAEELLMKREQITVPTKEQFFHKQEEKLERIRRAEELREVK